jgi:hypothetical protein
VVVSRSIKAIVAIDGPKLPAERGTVNFPMTECPEWTDESTHLKDGLRLHKRRDSGP